MPTWTPLPRPRSGACANAGQSGIGIEGVSVASAVTDQFLQRLVAGAHKLTVALDDAATLGPITMPAQLDTIRRHIADGLADGGRTALGGAEAVQPPHVQPTILVDVPEARPRSGRRPSARCWWGTGSETPTRAGPGQHAALRAGRVGVGQARWAGVGPGMRSGRTAVNSVLSFAAMPSLPDGGGGDSGLGRLHGDDGRCEFARSKAITTRRARSLLAASTLARDPAATARRVMAVLRLVHGRSRPPQPPTPATGSRR